MLLSCWGKKREHAFFRNKSFFFFFFFFFNLFNQFIVCMWTARCTRLKKTSWHFWRDIFFYEFLKNRIFRKLTRFWKSYKASSWDQRMWRFFLRGPQRHTLQSKFSPFCNWKCPPISYTSDFGVKIWNFSNRVFMRKAYSRKWYQKPLLMIQKHWILWNHRIGRFVYTVARRNVLMFSHCRQWCF